LGLGRTRGPEGRDREGEKFGGDVPIGACAVGSGTVIGCRLFLRLIRSGCETASARGQSPSGGGDGGN
jgi:hypothetical protein